MPALFPILVAAHVLLAIALVVPSLLLPFAVRRRRAPTESANPLLVVLVAIQRRWTPVIGAGLALTGAGLVVALGASVLDQPWLIVGLTTYAATLLLAFFVQRPGLRVLLGVRGAADDVVWQARARRQRYLSYAMAGLVGTIGILMSAKPDLW